MDTAIYMGGFLYANGRKWFYYDSPVMAISEEDAQKYDDTLPKMEKKQKPSQEEFFILSNAFLG